LSDHRGFYLRTCDWRTEDWQISSSAPSSTSVTFLFLQVHGIATADGPLNYDELVVYDEAAVLPYAIVTYEFQKLTDRVLPDTTQQQQQQEGAVTTEQEGADADRNGGGGGGGSNQKSTPIETLAELVAQSGVTEAVLLSYSKDDLRELMKDLGTDRNLTFCLLREEFPSICPQHRLLTCS
jgi:hypothetical protein